jgi:uncharacterized protein (TIGR00297 family)
VQSKALTWILCTILSFAALLSLISTFSSQAPRHGLWVSLAVSAIFGLAVWALGAATPGGIASGVLVCFLIMQSGPHTLSHVDAGSSALGALIAVFVISFAATRFGRRRKELTGLAESPRGRQASQIVANLGAAALFAVGGQYSGCIAALAEAAADTASSEVGQALGGTARLIASWKPVPPGTDGAISLSGTVAGVISALIVVVAGAAFHLTWRQAGLSFFSACAGLFFDSLLGATAERRGWIGNDLVNFLSTVFAALLAAALT